MIDRSLNYGRHLIGDFLKSTQGVRNIVDIGAGHGTDLNIASSTHPNAKLHAIECWEPYVNELISQGVSVNSLNIERDRLPFDDQSVDVVIANQVLEHTKELFWIFHETTRSLRVGGYFIIGVPNLASLHNRLLLAIGRQPSPVKSASAHVRGFTKSDLVNFVSDCFPGGYELVRFGGSNFYPFPSLIAKPLATAFPSFSWGIFLMFKKLAEYNGEFVKFPVLNKLETNFYLGS